MKGVVYGDPFLLTVLESNCNNQLDENDLSMVAKIDDEPAMISSMRESVQTHGGREIMYICIPLGQVWTDDPGAEDDATDAPNRVVNVDVTKTVFERMTRAAGALGVNIHAEEARHTDA